MDTKDFLGKKWQKEFEKLVAKVHNKEVINDNEIKEMTYQPEPARLNPAEWKLKIDWRLFDQNCHTLAECKTTGFGFNQPMPNKAFIYAYAKNGRKHFNGAAIILPELKSNNQYRLEIIEHWQFNTSVIAADVPKNNWREFTRKIIVPIQVNTSLNHPIWRKDILSQNYFNLLKQAHVDTNKYYDVFTKFMGATNEFDFYQKHPDTISTINKIDPKNNDLNDLGNQTLIMPNYFIPPLHFNYSFGIYDTFYGNFDMLTKSYKDTAKQLGTVAVPEIINLFKQIIDINIDNQINDTLNLLAASLGTNFYPTLCDTLKFYPELLPTLSHNHQGSNCINMFNLIYGKKSSFPRHDLLLLGCKNWRSIYDFEEVTPEFQVPCYKN